MSIKDDLIGAKGGSSSFRSRPDNLRSTDTFEALIGVTSGRIRGLAPGGLKNLFVDDVPIEDGAGNTTLKDFSAVLFNGDPAILQPVILQLGGSSGAQQVNLPVNNPYTDGRPGDWRFGTVPQAGVDYIDLRFVVSSLYRQDKKGIYDATASIEIELQPSGSSTWINPLQSLAAPTYNQNGISLNSGSLFYAAAMNWANGSGNQWNDPAPGKLAVTGKTTQPYVKELRIAVPNTGVYANKTWQVRARLVERDSYTQDENQEARTIQFESIAGVSMAPIGNREEWRGLAYLQVYGKASDQLTGVPTITGIYDLSEVRVPPSSVWNAETRVYSNATWDGTTEEVRWTQCPAFQMKDLIEDPISGISALVPGSTMNKWDALEASKWYAQLVPNGKGGTHPRYTMNYLLDSAMSVNDLMQYVAGAVGSYAWDEGDSRWRLVVEKPENATALFTKESIVGEFNYAHTDIDSRINDMVGVFRNEEQGYKEDRVRVFDQPHIDNYGRRASTIALVGCTNRQEALRRIKIRQLSSLYETRQVSFTTNRQGNLVQPFSVILVADGDLASNTSLRTTGRIVSKTSSTVTVRDTLRLEVGITYKLHITVPNTAYQPDTSVQPTSANWRKPTVTVTRNITNTASQRGDVTTIYIDAALPSNTPANAQVALEAVGLATLPKQYRVVEVEPQDNELVRITAIEIYTNKWNESDNVDESAILAQRPNRVIDPPRMPSGGMFSVNTYQATFQQKRVMTVRWDRPGSIWVDGFRVEYSLNDGPWRLFTEKTQDTYVELQQPQNGEYKFRISTIDRRGGISAPLIGVYELVDVDEGGSSAPVHRRGPLADRPTEGQKDGEMYSTTDQIPNVTFMWDSGQWHKQASLIEDASDVRYVDPVTGQPSNETVQDLKPAEPGATKGLGNELIAGRTGQEIVNDLSVNADTMAMQLVFGDNLKKYVDFNTTIVNADGTRQGVAQYSYSGIEQVKDQSSSAIQAVNLMGTVVSDGTEFGKAWQMNTDTIRVAKLNDKGQVVPGLESLSNRLSTTAASLGSFVGRIDRLDSVVIDPTGTTVRSVLTLDSNGYISGQINTNNGKFSTTAFRTDSFQIVSSDGQGQLFTPFTIVGNNIKMTNVEVDTFKAGSITINGIEAGLSKITRFTGNDVQVSSSESTVFETPAFQLGDGTIEGRAMATVSFTHDATTIVDAGSRVRLYANTGSGYVLVRNFVVGARTTEGNTYISLLNSFPILLLAVDKASLKLTVQTTTLGGGGGNGGHFIRNASVDIMQIGR